MVRYTKEFKEAERARYELLCRRAIESKDEFAYIIGLTKLRDLGYIVEEILFEESSVE